MTSSSLLLLKILKNHLIDFISNLKNLNLNQIRNYFQHTSEIKLMLSFKKKLFLLLLLFNDSVNLFAQSDLLPLFSCLIYNVTPLNSFQST